ncbi:amidohydrolase family protein [Granulicella sp. 5B5]|uniref:amidohydrolase family protein n=1 Tax=Granulicella sp. 5B5 TaxID=1617967 RepID=UPI0015F5C7EC|nr:amidohydrolase family protein [Granulicella sp. 5B5]QMV19428.1 amidohydrolase family protein [Granulicella sp. 5B5]
MPIAVAGFVVKRFVSVSLTATVLVTAAMAQKTITVTQGTDMQVAVSPNHKTVLADLQGMIYSIPFAGGTAKQLTDALHEESHPDWSAKGDLVALQSYYGGTFHIWTMHPDGSGLKQITFGHGDDREPRISPDGKTIAFTSDRAFEGSYDIWTVDIATGKLTRVTSSPADEFGPNWTPDGKSLAFISGTGIAGKSVELIDLATKQQKTLASIDPAKGRLEAPSFSPDGKLLAYVRFGGEGMFMDDAHLEVVTASGSKPVYTGKAIDTFPFPAVWLSDSELVYSGDGKILKTDVSARSEAAIPFSAAIPTWRPKYVHKHYDFDSTATRTVKGIYAPALSPDGKSVAFVALNQLYVMRIGGKPVAITHDSFYKQGPAWSPDGKTLAYVTDKDGIENIYLHEMNAASDVHDARVAPSESAEIMPAWSPDGKLIAFQDEKMATMIADVATGKIRLLAPTTFFPGRAAFSPNGKTVAIATIKPYTKRFREGTSQILTVDVATGKQKFFEPAPFESVTTRTEDGPIYAPNGKEMAFVMDDLLYTMPVDENGYPDGKARLLGDETTDAVTYSGDSKHLLFLSDGKLQLIDRATRKITPVAVDLTYRPSKPEDKILIHAARFWKGEGPDEQTDVDILITDNRITSVTPHSATVPAGVTRVIEAKDSTVMPGLWENHAHPDSDNGIYYGGRMGRLWLAYGVTELKGLADNAYRAVEHKESYVSGAAVGPRLFDTGEAIDGERVYYPMMIPTTSEAQLHREFARLKALDFDFVKLYVRLPFTMAKEGAAFGHEQMGVQSAGHYLLPAVDLGEDGMTHISATSRWGWAYSRSLTGRSYEDVHKLLVDSGMWTISTTFSQEPYKDDPGMATDVRQGIAPPWENARLKKAVDLAEHSDETPALQHLRDEEVTVADDFRKGGFILAGTDSPLDIPATSLHLNLRAQVKFGMKPWQSLETVTSLPAKAYGLDKDLGTLEPGHLADLIITAGNPLVNIDDTIRVECVMKNGKLWSVSQVAAPFAKVNTGAKMCPAQ